MDDSFRMFLESVDVMDQKPILEIHEFLAQNNCKCEVKSAKSGYVISYLLSNPKRTLANFVCRKNGVKIRVYANNVGKYQNLLNTFPDKIKKEIIKASVCKRLINPDDCNPRCSMGYTFILDGVECKKCRYMAFMPTVKEDSLTYIMQMLENEINA
ncbi:MAG TPA: hypothetical protein VJY54_12375 [Lachnospiraceae bacterium]|nr:hypothetical protein [Lachnospiraceae bacterium]